MPTNNNVIKVGRWRLINSSPRKSGYLDLTGIVTIKANEEGNTFLTFDPIDIPNLILKPKDINFRTISGVIFMQVFSKNKMYEFVKEDNLHFFVSSK